MKENNKDNKDNNNLENLKALENSGKVDSTYIASVIICPNCGEFNVEIEELEE